MLIEAIEDIILGRGVTRGSHRLVWNGKPVTGVFIGQLKKHGFKLRSVKETHIEPGQRAPAFLIREDEANFGYVFWEIFTENKKRKLFGSVEKNRLGDWKYILTEFKEDKIWVQLNRIEEIEIAENKRYG